jgi:uncharacterized protein YkwD
MGINFGPLGNNRLVNWAKTPSAQASQAPPTTKVPLARSGVPEASASFTRPNTLTQQAHALLVGTLTRVNALSDPLNQPSGRGPVSSWSAYSQQVLDLVNATRSYYGLAPLQQKFGLSYLAAKRSNDMAQNQYFSHNDLYGRTPEDRFRAEGISFRYGGENIAYGQTTPYQVVQDWMNSPGHRANILDPNYQYLGVGVGQDKYGRLFWSQEFSG